MKALICGSFDPVTNGHLDLIKRASRLFDEVTVGIFVNPDKKYLFSAEMRLSLLTEAIKDIDNAKAELCSGYVADYCKENGISAIVKGVRNTADYEYELEMAVFNKNRAPETETVFLPAYGEIAGISSSFVRELHAKGEDVSSYVPECVKKAFDSI